MMDEKGLPEEVVLSWILPLLSMKDVARSSLVSPTWLRYWRHTPILRFENPADLHNLVMISLKDYPTYSRALSEARASFMTWVNQILNKHTGSTVEEFKLAYYLNNTHRVFIDTCLVWALSKRVQRLVLDFTIPPVCHGSFFEDRHFYALHRTLIRTDLCLTSLCLNSVNVGTPTLTYLLDSCASTLDNLCIVRSRCLIAITTSSSALPSLKSFMVVDCPNLETIDIHAPNLVSLNFNSGMHTVLSVFNITNASKLSSATIVVRVEQRLLLVLRSVSKYFSHLDHLILKWHGKPNTNLVVDKFPVLANLNHLEIVVVQSARGSLAPWIPFIGSCPRLHKLTLEIRGWLWAVPRKNVYKDKCPLTCLKTFEIRFFDGVNLDVDLANFVVENGINFQEVILHPTESSLSKILPNLKAPFSQLDFKLPPHIKLKLVIVK